MAPIDPVAHRMSRNPPICRERINGRRRFSQILRSQKFHVPIPCKFVHNSSCLQIGLQILFSNQMERLRRIALESAFRQPCTQASKRMKQSVPGKVRGSDPQTQNPHNRRKTPPSCRSPAAPARAPWRSPPGSASRRPSARAPPGAPRPDVECRGASVEKEYGLCAG